MGEFSVRNKPVLTYSGQGSPSHDIEVHVDFVTLNDANFTV